MTPRQVAGALGISPSRVRHLCKLGRLRGATLERVHGTRIRLWSIPASALSVYQPVPVGNPQWLNRGTPLAYDKVPSCPDTLCNSVTTAHNVR